MKARANAQSNQGNGLTQPKRAVGLQSKGFTPSVFTISKGQKTSIHKGNSELMHSRTKAMV
jgi:hypothetical protein